MAHYVIRVEGLLSPGLTSAFPTLASELQAHSVVQGRFADQGQLAEVIARLRASGVDVVGVHRLPSRAGTTDRAPGDPGPAPRQPIHPSPPTS
jgi:hypothetical protein